MPKTLSSETNDHFKTKISVLIKRDIFEHFTALVQELGLRRDAFLNQNLRGEVDTLRGRQGGGRQGEAFRRAIRTAQETDLVPVGITLDRELAQKLTEVCAQKHVLRDEFVEMTLVVFGKALECAATYISNPGADGAIEYQNEYDHLAMSDDEANSMISKILQAAETQRKD